MHIRAGRLGPVALGLGVERLDSTGCFSIHLPPIVVQLLSHVWLFATPWTASCQASVSFTISLSVPRLMSFLSVKPSISSSVSPFSSCPQFFPAWIFPVSQVFASGGHSFGASALASALPINIQGWVPLGLTGLISLLSKGLSRVFYSTTKCLPSVFLWALPTWCGDTSDTFLLKDGEVLASCAFIPCPILPCVMLTVRYQLLYVFNHS